MDNETLEKFKESIANRNKTCCDELKIKRIPVKLQLSDYIITFEYITWKSKKRKKGEMIIKHYSRLEARDYFRKWIKTIRTMSNVEILDTVELKETRQEVVL